MHSSLYVPKALVNSMYQASNSTLVCMCHQLLHRPISNIQYTIKTVHCTTAGCVYPAHDGVVLACHTVFRTRDGDDTAYTRDWNFPAHKTMT